MSDITSKKDINIEKIFEDNKGFLFPILFYIAGVLMGALLYKSMDISKIIDTIIKAQDNSYISVFINKISVYLIIFTLTILIGLCIFGFPIINFIPLIIGFVGALKIAYYYNLYSIKGIGYSALIIVPQISTFMVVLLFTIVKSSELSRSVFNKTTNKSINDIDTKAYLKSFSIYFIEIIIIGLVNSLMLYLLNSIITI